MAEGSQHIAKVLIVILLLMLIALGGYAISLKGRLEETQKIVDRIHSSSTETASNPSGPSPSRSPLFDDLSAEQWNPWKEMNRMREEMDHLFGDSFARLSDSGAFSAMSTQHSFSPNIDIQEETNRYVVTVDVPGADSSTLDVRVENGHLIVSGSVEGASKETSEEKHDTSFMLRERMFGSFQRTVPLPRDADENKARHEYRNGVIQVILPKRST